MKRRDFVRFLVAGSIYSGCPFDVVQAALKSPGQPRVEGEDYQICHQLRDGKTFTAPPASSRRDVVIVGGGMSGLVGAYRLRDLDFLLLEKEAHWGGNAYQLELAGQLFATGSAFAERGDATDTLAGEIGLKLLPVDNPDGSIINRQFIPDTWGKGLDHLPYPVAVRNSFKKCRDDLGHIRWTARKSELDLMLFAELLRPYASEVKLWWDTYGPSNWGGTSQDLSAYVALSDVVDLFHGPDERVTLPGGLGAVTKRLAEMLLAQHRNRMLAGGTVVGVEQKRDRVLVTYYARAALQTVEAKAVIVAAPKFIARRFLAGLPDAQNEAMGKLCYAPYAVINLVFDQTVFDRGYDTWCPGNTFTDFIVADWVVEKAPGYRRKKNILTCYTPLKTSQRAVLLTEESCRQLAARALKDFLRLFPGLSAQPVEVQLFRRGHPIFVPGPGIYTRVIPAAAAPLDRVFFANTDSEGPISTADSAIRAADRASEMVRRRLAKR